MKRNELSGTRLKLGHCRRLSVTRGLELRTTKNSQNSTTYPTFSRPYKQMLNSKLDVSTNESSCAINWELNEKISLSSGSSTGIEIRPDTKRGIGFMDKHKLKTSQSYHDTLSMNTNKYFVKSDTMKTAGLLNVYKEDKETNNILKSDSKYEIGIPGECTISRKKRQERKKVVEGKLKYSKNNVDLTGTVRRRWIPSNQKIDDSISKRLELIHELNQKILANYERFQIKSKKASTKSMTRDNENLKNSLKSVDEKNRIALSDLPGNQEHIYAEISHKHKCIPVSNQMLEKVVANQERQDSLVTKIEKDRPKPSQSKVRLKSYGDNFSHAKMPELHRDNDSHKESGNISELTIKCEVNSPVSNDCTFHNDPQVYQPNETVKMSDTSTNLSTSYSQDLLESSKLYPESDVHVCTDNWKDKLYTTISQDQLECKIVNTTLKKNLEPESTKNLEKEILDNLNETIGKFDNEQIQLDEGAGSGVDDDSFSEDSIQITSPSPITNRPKDASHQETFNSSWDSGVGVDVGSGSGWVRIHTGIESSLVYLTLDTTAKDICRDMLLGDELSLYIQV